MGTAAGGGGGDDDDDDDARGIITATARAGG